MKGDVEQILWNDLPGLDRKKEILIDLRNPGELDREGIMPAPPYPLPQLRKRLAEFDKGKKYVAFCAAGLRSYIGYRILKQKGFQVRSLAGGFGLLKGLGHKVGARVK